MYWQNCIIIISLIQILLFVILILVCPKLKVVRQNTTSISFNFSLETHEASIPFMGNYRQHALFILAPKHENYKPDMDWITNSNALEGNAKKLVAWDQHEYNWTRSVMLSIDSVYMVVLRVYGKLLEGTGTANKTEHFATLDCPQTFGKLKILSTKSWRCLNGDQISAEDVCNTIHNCNDSSDERPFLCKGSKLLFWLSLVILYTQSLLLEL